MKEKQRRTGPGNRKTLEQVERVRARHSESYTPGRCGGSNHLDIRPSVGEGLLCPSPLVNPNQLRGGVTEAGNDITVPLRRYGTIQERQTVAGKSVKCGDFQEPFFFVLLYTFITLKKENERPGA